MGAVEEKMIASFGYMHRDNRCMYMAHDCFYVCCSDCVGVCGNVCCVEAIVKSGVLKYVVCLCSGYDGCLYCNAWSCRCSCMGSVSVSSCRCMFVSCVHPVALQGSQVREKSGRKIISQSQGKVSEF